MKKSLRYIWIFISVCCDIIKDETRFIWVPLHNIFRRKKPAPPIFDERDPYFEPYKNDNA